MNSVFEHIPHSFCKAKTILVFCACLASLSLIAQQDIIPTEEELLSYEDGLPSRTIMDLYEDSEGFLWVGTTLGLCRYDGVSFETYDDNIVTKIFEDRNSNLWLIGRNNASAFKMENGERIIDPTVRVLDNATKEVSLLDKTGKSIPFRSNEISDVNQDYDFNLWISTKTGKIYNYDGEKFELKYDNSDTGVVGGAIKSAKNEIVFLENGKFISYNLVSGKRIEEDFKRMIRDIYVDKFDRVWLLDWGTFQLHNGGDPNFHNTIDHIYYKDPGKPIQVYQFEDRDTLKDAEFKSIWFDRYSAEAQLYRVWNSKVETFDRDGKFISRFVFPEEILNKFFEIEQQVLKGSGNIFWIEGLDGLHKFVLKNKNIKNILQGSDNQIISTRGILKLDTAHLLVTSYHTGLIKYNLIDQSFEYIHKPSASIGKNVTYGFEEGREGEIWLGTDHYSIQEYNPLDNSIKEFYAPNNSPGGVLQLQIPFWDDLANKLWIGTLTSGLYYLDEATEDCIPFEKYNSFEQLKDARVNCFHKRGDKIWIGTNIGVFIFTDKEGVIKHYNNLLANNIIDISEDENGLLWLGTAKGLIRWNVTKNEQKLYSTKDGFPNNYIYSVNIDEFGYFWLPTNKGLVRFNPETDEIYTFLPSTGLTDAEFNFSSRYTDEQGVLYLGTINGVNIIDPRDFVDKEKDKVKLAIKGLEIVKEKVPTRSYLNEFRAEQKIDFTPDVKSILLEFALLDFTKTGIQRYAYKIGGYSEDWTYIKEDYLRIFKLPYGNFDLMIKGIGGKGVWSEPIHIPVHVLKPWYLKTPALLTYVGLLFLSVYFYVKSRLAKLKKRQHEIELLVEERTEELSEKNTELEEANRFKDKVYSIIAHDLRGPAFGLQGVGLKLNYLIKTKQFEELENFGGSVEESISSLNTLLDNLLKWANQNMKSITINKEPLVLVDLVEQSLRELKVSWDKKRLNMENNIGSDVFLFADKQTVLTILRNIIANAIKFTPEDGKISINSEGNEKYVTISVEDNGIGISPERIPHLFDIEKNTSTLGTNGEKGTGLGLGVCKELAILNGGELEVKSIPGVKTIFYISLSAHSHVFSA